MSTTNNYISKININNNEDARDIAAKYAIRPDNSVINIDASYAKLSSSSQVITANKINANKITANGSFYLQIEGETITKTDTISNRTCEFMFPLRDGTTSMIATEE